MNQKIKQIGIFLIRVYDNVCDVCAYISAGMMLVMTLNIGYEVTMRYIFIRPTSWVNDFTDYTLLYTTFLAGAWLLKHGGHVNLTYLTDRLSQRSKRIMEAITSILGAIVCVFVICYGTADSWSAFERGIYIDRPTAVPKYLIIGVIPFGCLLLFVQFVRNIFKSLSVLEDRP
jgi:TRAP-type C4-dicarboxylate transport system permease small subunit